MFEIALLTSVSIILIYASLQSICASLSWKCVPKHLRPNINEVLDVMMGSRAISTARSYLNEITKFYRWCTLKEIPLVIPFSSTVVAVYLMELFKDKGKSSSCIVRIHAALKWLHSFCPTVGLNPLDTGFCHNIVEAAKRSKVAPIKKKTPMSSTIVKEIIEKYGGDDANLKDLRLATLVCLGFAGFLRFNELSNIRPVDLTFEKDCLKILINKSKTDIYRKGNILYIARTTSKYCPVMLLERYIKVAQLSLSSILPLFRSISKTKRGFVLRKQRLSYSRCREMFKAAIDSLGYNSSDYGLHSLRSGGITTAVAENSSISERLLKLHGRWKSDISKDMYILETHSNRLKVSRSLCL